MVAVLVCRWGLASAQTVSPSQLTPKDLRPTAAPVQTIRLPAAAGLTAPAGADKVSLNLRRVIVEGGFDDLAAENAAVAKRLTGGAITVADVYVAANDLERAYAAAGYVLARVVVPPQKLDKGGALRLIVVDGYVESVDVNGVPSSQRALIAARMAPLIGRRHIKLADIERRLLLSGDDPGLTLRSTIAAGAKPGATKLVLEAIYNPVTGTVGIDNHLPASLGVYSLNASLAINSALGFGEQIYATASTGYQIGDVFTDRSPFELFGGGVSLPLGIDGFVLNPEYTHSVSRPFPPTGAPASVGYFERFDLRASYPLIETRPQTLVMQATLEWDKEHLSPLDFATELYRDSYGVGRLQADDKAQFPIGASAEALGAISQGLGGRGAAQAAASGIALSRQGASPDFTKANLTLRWTQDLPAQLELALTGHGQSSFGKPLITAESFSLDGPDAISGFASGTFSVDEGAVFRGEIGRPIPISANGWQTVVAPYLFASGGRGFIDQATAVEQSAISASAFGLGVRTGVDLSGRPMGAALALEAARFASNAPDERAGWRGNISFQIKF
jgi:hemolysin activation/secretion protein